MIRINGRLRFTEEEKEMLRRKPRPWLKNNLNMLGKFHSQETKKKIMEAAIKRWSNKSERKKQSIRMQGECNPMYGKHHTQKSKIKLSNDWKRKHAN